MKRSLKFALVALSLMPLASCGNSTPSDTTVLDAYVYKAGYGSEWIEELATRFAQQSWVKEKYGNVQVNFREMNKEESYAEGQIEASSSKYDIYFGMNLQSLIGKKGSNRKLYLEDLSDVYDSEVPGEGVLYKNKMIESAVISNQVEDSSGDINYYTVPWAGGFNGIMYNPDVLSKYSLNVPVTTDELVAAMKTITAGEGKAVIQGCNDPGSCYWTYMFPTWWAQYQGLEGYINFWHGRLNSTDADFSSRDIFKQQGRLESLEVLESILANYTNGENTVNNLDESCNGIDYMKAQTSFLGGGYGFMACGDWFDYEMDYYRKATKKDLANVSMMKNPVISSIIDVLPDHTIADDATLAKVVKAIDEDKTSYEGVSASDFTRVAEARQMAYTVGNYHSAVIPSCSDQINLGKDFLRYLATDDANEVYIEKTMGSGMYFRYNLQEKNPTLYESLTSTGKMRAKLYGDQTHQAVIIPNPNNYRLFRDGQVGLLTAHSASKFELFYRQSNAYTAQKFYDDDINYWDESAWAMLLRRIGA